MSDETVNTLDPIFLRLRALAQKLPALEDAVLRYETILPLLHDSSLHVGNIPLTIEQVHDKIRKGQPLLFGMDLEIDMDSARDLIIKLSRALDSPSRGNGSRTPDAARGVRLALENSRLDIAVLFSLVAAGKIESIASHTERFDLDAEFLVMLIQNALKPTLRQWRSQLSPLTEGIEWHKGFCFVCGAVASLGELQGNNQSMHLRCGQCGADWSVRRLRCLYCGNEDHTKQNYLYIEDDREKMHLETCDKCRSYIKVIAAFDPTPAEMLPLEELATLHLDHIAQERGYVRWIARESTRDKPFSTGFCVG